MDPAIPPASSSPTEGKSLVSVGDCGTEAKGVLLPTSASGCPIANRNKMRVLEAGGTVEQHKAAVAAATAMKFDGKYIIYSSLIVYRELPWYLIEFYPNIHHIFISFFQPISIACTTVGSQGIKKPKFDEVTMVYPKGYTGEWPDLRRFISLSFSVAVSLLRVFFCYELGLRLVYHIPPLSKRGIG